MRLAGFCDKDTATALRLAGIKELFVPKDDELAVWNKIREKEDIGVLFVLRYLIKKVEKRIMLIL